MGLSFGNISAKNVCFNVPDTTPIFDALKLPDLNIKPPKLGLPDFGKLNFGGIETTIEIPTINIPKLPSFNNLNFGGIDNLKNKIANLKIPTTICINVGGEYGFDSIFTQIGDILYALTPKIPSTTIPPIIQGGNISIIPAMLISPSLPIDLTLEQALEIVKNNCLASLLDTLRNLDPLERLKKLFEIAADLCSKMLFSELRDVIEEIQRTQTEILANALSTITDPLQKMAKLIDMANDALNAGSYEMLQQISNLLGGTQYQSLMEFLDKLDPTIAISALTDEIKNLVQLKNFGAINQLLTILQSLKSKVKGISDLSINGLSLPELAVDELQTEINKLLDSDDILGIQKLLADFMRTKYNLIDELKKLDPNVFLMQALPLLNSALKNLELGLFNVLIKDLADKLCLNNSQPTP
jgi:hypothetical protein